MRTEDPITYTSTGVNYDAMDPIKRLAQLRARATSDNLRRTGLLSMESSRGESAYVWDEGEVYRASVIEGLGTKNLVADAVRKISGRTHYDAIAQDTVAMIVNDLITVGADPQVINAYFAVGDSSWFDDEERARDLVNGWAKACTLSGAAWGAGETPTLKGIINPLAIDLSGSAIGIIKPKERYTLRTEKLQEGDVILLVESSGIHANGLTLARRVAEELPDGYATELPNGELYGEALLKPTHIYASLVRQLFHWGIDIHYLANITGHGWRKLMRSNQEFTYVLDRIPTPQPEFDLIREVSGNDEEEMYGNFNMGAGFAIYLPSYQAEEAQDIADRHNLRTWDAGYLEKGEKQVVIKAKNITFKADTLQVR